MSLGALSYILYYIAYAKKSKALKSVQGKKEKNKNVKFDFYR